MADEYKFKIVKDTPEGMVVPEADEIKKMPTAKVVALYEDLTVGGGYDQVPGFDKMNLTEKRQSVINMITQEQVDTDQPPEPEKVSNDDAPGAELKETGGQALIEPMSNTVGDPDPTAQAKVQSVQELKDGIIDKALSKGVDNDSPSELAPAVQASVQDTSQDKGASKPDKPAKKASQTPGKSPKAQSLDVGSVGKALDVVKLGMTSKDPAKDLSKLIESTNDVGNVEKLVVSLTEAAEVNDFLVGAALARLQATPGHWSEKYPKFTDYVSNTFGMDPRKALYLISNYTDTVKHEIPWDTFKGLGWSKIRYLRPLFKEGPAVVEEWVEKALNMSSQQLQAEVKAHLDGQKVQGPASTTHVKSFKLHDDQKQVVDAALGKAKEEFNTTVEAAALEHLSQAYLSGQIPLALQKQAALPESSTLKGFTADQLDMMKQLMNDPGFVRGVLGEYRKAFDPNNEGAVEFVKTVVGMLDEVAGTQFEMNVSLEPAKPGNGEAKGSDVASAEPEADADEGTSEAIL
jgi:hypothetical protein